MEEHFVNGILTPLWEWWIVWYFFLGGIAGGAYFTATVVESVGDEEDRPIARTGYYIAFPLILLCAVCLIFDLGMPQRFWHMMVYRKTLLPWPNWDSAISVGSYAVGVFGLFSFLSFLDALVETGRLPWAPLREKYSGVPRRLYSILGAIAGFFLASYTGVLLSTTHIPAWADTPLLGALFAASALSTGVATIALVLAWRGYDVAASWAKLKRTDNWAMIIEIILLVAFLVMASGVAGPLFSGPSLILLGLILVLGLLTPPVAATAHGAYSCLIHGHALHFSLDPYRRFCAAHGDCDGGHDTFTPPTKRIITSGCGGGVTFDDLSERHPPLPLGITVTPRQIVALMQNLHLAAELYNEVRGVHTSALSDGHELCLVAQDVGRHNTIDRLWGQALQKGMTTENRLLLASGRISSEMLNKAAKMGVPIIASRTSPTSMSVELARAWNITVIGYARGNQFRVYSGAERICTGMDPGNADKRQN